MEKSDEMQLSNGTLAESPALPGPTLQSCSAQAGLGFPCQLQLIHGKQETETAALLKNTSCFPGSPREGGRAGIQSFAWGTGEVPRAVGWVNSPS